MRGRIGAMELTGFVMVLSLVVLAAARANPRAA